MDEVYDNKNIRNQYLKEERDIVDEIKYIHDRVNQMDYFSKKKFRNELSNNFNSNTQGDNLYKICLMENHLEWNNSALEETLKYQKDHKPFINIWKEYVPAKGKEFKYWCPT